MTWHEIDDITSTAMYHVTYTYLDKVHWRTVLVSLGHERGQDLGIFLIQTCGREGRGHQSIAKCQRSEVIPSSSKLPIFTFSSRDCLGFTRGWELYPYILESTSNWLTYIELSSCKINTAKNRKRKNTSLMAEDVGPRCMEFDFWYWAKSSFSNNFTIYKAANWI